MFEKVKHLVFTPDLNSSALVQEAKAHAVECIPVLDARSAVYVATGICAQNKEIVVVCLDSGNASRSAFSGMTEAYYRALPVVLITCGTKLDYSKELNDVVYGHYVVQTQDQIEQHLETKLPIHIEWVTAGVEIFPHSCERIYDCFRKVVNDEVYLYVGQGVCAPKRDLPCKVVKGGMPGCLDGAMANVLGASLAKRHKRYIGLISEEEYTHDINTLGNIHINETLMFVVVTANANMVLENYAKSLGFTVYTVQEKELEPVVERLVHSSKKTVLFVLQEG